MMNLNDSRRGRVEMRNREGSEKGLRNRNHYDHSLGSEEHPVQEYPWQNQHNYANGKTKHEPVPKIDAFAFWVIPEEIKPKTRFRQIYQYTHQTRYQTMRTVFINKTNNNILLTHFRSKTRRKLTGGCIQRKWGWRRFLAGLSDLRWMRSRQCRVTGLCTSCDLHGSCTFRWTVEPAPITNIQKYSIILCEYEIKRDFVCVFMPVCVWLTLVSGSSGAVWTGSITPASMLNVKKSVKKRNVDLILYSTWTVCYKYFWNCMLTFLSSQVGHTGPRYLFK